MSIEVLGAHGDIEGLDYHLHLCSQIRVMTFRGLDISDRFSNIFTRETTIGTSLHTGETTIGTSLHTRETTIGTSSLHASTPSPF